MVTLFNNAGAEVAGDLDGRAEEGVRCCHVAASNHPALSLLGASTIESTISASNAGDPSG